MWKIPNEWIDEWVERSRKGTESVQKGENICEWTGKEKQERECMNE